MIVNLSDLNRALMKIKSFAESNQQAPGVLLNIEKRKLSVCYSDAKKAVVERINVEEEEGDIEGAIIVDYERLCNIVNVCMPYGDILTKELSLSFNKEDKVVTFYTEKYIRILRPTGEVDLTGEMECVEDEKLVMKVQQKLKYFRPEDNRRFGVLSRMDYDRIFSKAEEENCDIWPCSELRNVLSRNAKAKGKVLYVSGKMKAAFVNNLAYVSFTPQINCDLHGFTAVSNVAKQVSDILNKVSDEQVRVYVEEKRFANIVGEDVGIWFEIAPASKADMVIIQRYQERYGESHEQLNMPKADNDIEREEDEDGYYEQEIDRYHCNSFITINKSFGVVIVGSALINVVNSAMSLTNEDRAALEFVESENGLKMINIISLDSHASIDNNFSLALEGSKFPDWELMLQTKMVTNLKVLKDILDECKTTYIAFDVIIDNDSSKYMRIAEIEDKDEEGGIKYGAIYYTILSK